MYIKGKNIQQPESPTCRCINCIYCKAELLSTPYGKSTYCYCSNFNHLENMICSVLGDVLTTSISYDLKLYKCTHYQSYIPVIKRTFDQYQLF